MACRMATSVRMSLSLAFGSGLGEGSEGPRLDQLAASHVTHATASEQLGHMSVGAGEADQSGPIPRRSCPNSRESCIHLTRHVHSANKREPQLKICGAQHTLAGTPSPWSSHWVSHVQSRQELDQKLISSLTWSLLQMLACIAP